LDGKAAVVTGGSRGIGRAIALETDVIQIKAHWLTLDGLCLVWGDEQGVAPVPSGTRQEA
jgi:hypothetical protein